MPIINGQPGAYRQPARYGKGDSGRFTEWIYEGTKNEIVSLVPIIEASGGQWDIEESFTGGKDKLTARFAFIPGGSTETEVEVNDWEFFAGESEKDIMESDLLAVQGITDADKRIIRKAIFHAEEDAPDPALSGNALELYLLMLQGLRSTKVLTPTLRHTMTVSNRYTIPASFTNVGRIISTNAMTALESIPNDILFSLPNLTYTGGTDPTLFYGWYKKHPTVRKAALQKSQIVQEWEYGLWSPLQYGTLVT